MQDVTIAFVVLWVCCWGIGFAFLPSYRRNRKRAANSSEGSSLVFGASRAKGIWLWMNSVGTLVLGTCFLTGAVVYGVQDLVRSHREARMATLAVRCQRSPGSIEIVNQGERNQRIKPTRAHELEWSRGPLAKPSRYRLHLVDPRTVDLAPGQAARFGVVSDGPLCADGEVSSSLGPAVHCEVELSLCFLDESGDEDFCGFVRCVF